VRSDVHYTLGPRGRCKVCSPAVPRYVLLLLLALPSSAWSSVDPSAAGRFAVGVTTRTFVDATRGRTLVTEIWYPAETAGRDVPARRPGHRLVLVAHGNCGFRTNYEYLTVPLASWGFVVAAPDFPTFNKTDCDNGVPLGDLINDPPLDISFLRTALHDPAGPAGDLARVVRGRRAGLVGHSLGGAAVVRAALADASFTAVVALAPLLTGVTGPRFIGLQPPRAVFVMGGSADTTLPFDTFGKAFFDALPAPAYLLEIIGGTHSGFTDVDAHSTPEALARQQALTDRYTVAFLERFLGRRRRFRTFLTTADAAAQGPDAELTVTSR
jgi:predicted dienelactone hydrolase